MKELRIDFQGVVAFVPDRPLGQQPPDIYALVRNLRRPTPVVDASGVAHVVGVHDAWLEFAPNDHLPGASDPAGISTVTNGFTGLTRSVFLLDAQHLSLRLDGQPLVPGPIAIDPSVLAHLAVYSGSVKKDYRPSKKGNSALAAAIPLTGGSLTVTELTSEPYQVPLHDGTIASTAVATTLRWSIPFVKEATVRLVSAPTAQGLRFRPAGSVLQLAIRNRELDQLLGPPLPALGGQDDPEFLIYGDSILGGRPEVLRSTNGPIPAGRRACGTAAIQP